MISPKVQAASVMVLWAMCFPLITLGLDHAPHLTFATLRALLAGAMLLLIAFITRASFPKRRIEWIWISVAGLSMTSLGYFGMFHAAEFVSPGFATVLESLQPLIAAVLAFMILGEKLTRASWTGLVLGFAGIALMALPRLYSANGSSTLLGIAFVMLATLGVATGNIAIKRIAKELDASVAMGLQLVIGAVPLFAIAAITEDPTQINWSGQVIFSLLGLALPGTALAYWLWQNALRNLDLSKAVGFSFLVPIIGITVGVAFFDEQLNFFSVAGASISIFGIYLATRTASKERVVRMA